MTSADYIMELISYLDAKVEELGYEPALIALREKLTADHRAAALGYLKLSEPSPIPNGDR